MASKTLEAQPLACVPGAIPKHERASHFALAKRLLRAGSAVARREGNPGRFLTPCRGIARRSVLYFEVRRRGARVAKGGRL